MARFIEPSVTKFHARHIGETFRNHAINIDAFSRMEKQDYPKHWALYFVGAGTTACWTFGSIEERDAQYTRILYLKP